MKKKLDKRGQGCGNERARGLQYVREVRYILEAWGCVVEGPGYRPQFIGKGMMAVHTDYFGVFDLIAIMGNIWHGHQVTSGIGHKAEKVRKIRQAVLWGFVWVRVKGPTYRIFFVDKYSEYELSLDSG